MIFTSGINQKQQLASQVFDWFASQTDLQNVDVEVFHTNLSDDGVFGWCEQSDDNEFLISIHNELSASDYVITLLHELVHVRQTLCGLFDDDEREHEAHQLEHTLFTQFCLA
jgi:Zn-dependent peptidase ImmA (M78 family)